MAEKIEVSTRYYEFVMDPDVPFKQGRYEGSSLGNLTDTGWYWKLEDDESITAYFGHLAFSKIDLKPLLDAIDDETFEIIKRDVMRGDIPFFARIFYGWRDLDYLSETIDHEIETLEDLTEEEKERIYYELDFEKIADESGQKASKDIINLLKKAKDLSDMLKIIRSDEMMAVVWEGFYAAFSDHLIEAIEKVKKHKE